MPPGAFASTDRQISGLLAGSGPLRLDRYTLGDPPDAAAAYEPWTALVERDPEVVVVTGTEPVAPTLRAEPCWGGLAALLEWCAAHARVVVASCLAAHAALDLFDGLPRRPLDAKLSGVFEQTVRPGGELAAGLGSRVTFPHSRLNEVPRDAVALAGWQEVAGCDAVGWSVLTRQVGSAAFVLLQGHPEYDATALLREYRRDVRRWGETGGPVPVLPARCAAPADQAGLERYHAALLGGGDPPGPDWDAMAARCTQPWSRAAARLYRNVVSMAAPAPLASGRA